MLAAVLATAAAIYDPKSGVAPPGSANFEKIINWIAWGALGACVVGVLIAGGTMAFASRHGQGGEHATRLGWVAAGAVVIGSAATVVTQLTAGS